MVLSPGGPSVSCLVQKLSASPSTIPGKPPSLPLQRSPPSDGPMAEDSPADVWFEAIDCDDEELVKSMAEQDPSLLSLTFNEAAYEEDIAELAKELLGAGIGPLSPIQYACFVESEDSALVLIDLYTDEQLSAKWGEHHNTLFHLAAFNGLEMVIKRLLKRDIPFTLKNKGGFRPMDCVANDATRDVFVNFRFHEEEEEPSTPQITESRHKKMVDKTELPQTPEKVREEQEVDDGSEYEIPEYPPLRRIDPNARPKKPTIKHHHTPRKTTPVRFEVEPTYFDCCRNGEFELAKKFILEHKQSPNAKTFTGITVLHMAVEGGNQDLIKFLIDKGAAVNAVDIDGWSALHLACSQNSVDSYRILIASGADVNMPTKDGEFCLELTESEELMNIIMENPKFDKSLLDIIASRPVDEDDEEKQRIPILKKLRRKTSFDPGN